MRRDCRSNIRLNSEEVEIFRRGDEIIFNQKGTSVAAARCRLHDKCCCKLQRETSVS